MTNLFHDHDDSVHAYIVFLYQGVTVIDYCRFLYTRIKASLTMPCKEEISTGTASR